MKHLTFDIIKSLIYNKSMKAFFSLVIAVVTVLSLAHPVYAINPAGTIDAGGASSCTANSCNVTINWNVTSNPDGGTPYIEWKVGSSVKQTFQSLSASGSQQVSVTD